MNNDNNFNNNLQHNNPNENKQNENKTEEKKKENQEFSLEDIKKFVTEVVSQKVPDDKKDKLKNKYVEELDKKIDEINRHIATDKQARNNLYQRIVNKSKDLEMLEMYKNIIENCK